MAYINDYWVNKTQRAEQAERHTEEMEEKYIDTIEEIVKDTIVYYPAFKTKSDLDRQTGIVVEPIDSVSAIIKYHSTLKNKTAVLNFSSYKNAGGMFLKGSKAQEECLCHESFLYNVLSRFTADFYSWNRERKNKALYLNKALYTPDILFQRDDISSYCDVITCAAPNKTAAQRYQKVSDEENLEALRSRIKFVLDIAIDNRVDTLILGAYGCGVFGQNPIEVASIFKEYLNTTHKCFKKVVFAIPQGKDGNLEAFRKVFDMYD